MKSIDKKPRRKRCVHCGKLKPKEEVTYCINPYMEDVEGKIVKQNLCTICYNDLCDDI